MSTAVRGAPGAVLDRDHVLTSDHPDGSLRWTPGERLHHVFEATCDRLRGTGRAAVSRGDLHVTYDELDALANRLARFLRSRGVLPGDRVGLVLDDPVWAYAGMLAVLKLHAAYVPLDAGFPPDRMAFIVEDAGATAVLTLAHLAGRVAAVDAQVLVLDEAPLDGLDGARPEAGTPASELSYVIYTSGTTGRPKGVPIEHASIVNFVRVAAEVYGVRPDDRMYQGLTLAFDFSVEEIWVTWAVGATLVPKPGANLLGDDLARFLRDERVTAMCCVPTLLATMEDDLPDLRFLLVSGEACPQDLVARWHRPERRFLNTYGPTEATVTATWTTVAPGRRVTIGVPLPTYSVLVLAEDSDAVLPRGGRGEIAIGGLCLAPGYLNRPDATARAFVPDPVGVADNPSGQVYRTGDLGRITDANEIEYLGRLDTQVKIRGYRIELTEIESVLLQLPGVAQAVVDTYRPDGGAVELVAYYTERATVDVDAVFDALRERLPSYMVPAYLERLAAMPMLPSDKADRKNLPPPRGPRRVAVRGEHVPPDGEVEEVLATAVADLLGLDTVSVEGHFFEELGLNSLLLAQLRTRLRDHPAIPPLATQDMYRNPTIRSLAAVLPDAVPRAAVRAVREVRRASTAAYVLTGMAQAALYLGFAYLVALIGVTGFGWLSGATGLLDVYLRAVALSGVTLVVLTLLPVAAKWVLIGHWKPDTIPIWGWRYLRFWVVRQLLRTSPALLFVGSPVYALYLRMLGAKVGPGAVILSTSLPVCADLITVGEGATIRKDSMFTGYRAESGWIRTGPVTIGDGALVGEHTVLDIDTVIGPDAQLGHTSSLQVGQCVPAGARFHGSPARETTTDYRMVEPRPSGRGRRVGYSVFQVLAVLLGWGPLVTGIAFTLLPTVFPGVGAVSGPTAGGNQYDFLNPGFYLQHFLITGAFLFGAALLGLLVASTLGRLLGRAVRAGETYPLYGLRYSAHRAARRLGNLPFFHTMLGDSSYIVGYLRAIGYDLSTPEHTGSNFGLVVKHDSAVRTHVGSGTLVSDGLSVVNADYSSTSFAVSDVSMGARSFFGNAITYPAQGRTGDNCLLGTKTMVPVDGPVRSGVGLLGSPPFEIPRSVQRDASHDRFRTGDEFRTRLARKNRHNAATIAFFLLYRWLQVFITLLIGLAATDFYDEIGLTAFAVALIAMLVSTTLFAVLVERLALGFRRLVPRFCSIYEPPFWRHERLWKLSGIAYLLVFNGTPFKPWIWRMLGVRVGRKLFDDGATLPEKTMVTIGDHCTLGAESTIQCHSLEDASFKSDHIVIGNGVTVGAHTYVHYGVRMGDRTVLDPDAFLMKGEQTPPDTRWRGNPAQEIAAELPVRERRRRGDVLRARPLAAAALGALAVGQVAVTALRTPASAGESALVDAAFTQVRGLATAAPAAVDPVALALLAGYARLTGAFDRHADVLTGARELVVLGAAVTVMALLMAAWWLRVRPVLVAAGLALLVAVAGTGTAAPVPSTHAALADWLTTATDPATTVAVAPGLWADLVRDGVPVQRLTPDGQLVAGPAAPGPGDLARFGPLTVSDPDGVEPGTSGAQLAANRRIVTSPAVREALRTGTLDIRAVAVLAGLAGRGPVPVADIPALPGETPELARHVVVLGPVDPATLAWLQAQRAPYAPTVTTTGSGTTLSWPVPPPTALR